MDEHVVVVGAGPAGLAAAWALRRAGLDPLVVEQADAVAASWRGRHDHLRLNTHRMFSHQPGARIPRRYGSFPPATTTWPTCRNTPRGCGCGWAPGCTRSTERTAAGRDVLVVSPGNSGVDLLGYLAASDAGRLWLSAPSGMTVTPRRLGGVPLHPVSVALRRVPVRWQDGTARAVQRLAFGLDSSIYGNMHVHRGQARQLARAIARRPPAD